MTTVITNIGWFAAGAIAMLVGLLALADRRDRPEAPAEPVELLPELVAEVEPEPEPAVEPTEIVAPMKVIRPWPKSVADPEPIQPAWRQRLELESTPMFGGLPDHVSTWRMPSWNLDDPDRTQMWPIVEGVDAMDLDVEPGEPQPLPGFQVDPIDRRRLSLSEELIAEVTASLPSQRKAGAR